MASSVFYRFKSSKEPSRVTFDGTGISVFELKREIIARSGLGNGLDFELALFSNDGSEEYQDDTELVPRSTTVIAKRTPAARPGKGGAARYVSGKAPVNAKSQHRVDNLGPKSLGRGQTSTNLPIVSESQTEEQRMEAILKMGADQWKQKREEMKHDTYVNRPGMKRTGRVPDHPPPPHYICHRCEKKGHWLQECPETNNPAFDDHRRVKRTVGIPRSQLEIIQKATIVNEDGQVEDAQMPPGAMLDADGNWVIAKPDKVAWERFQEQANKSATAKAEAAKGNDELEKRGLQCPLDKRLFVDPVQTPCCATTYCRECITNALLDDGLRCPHCHREGVPVDDLSADAAMAIKVADYKAEVAESVGGAEGPNVTQNAEGQPTDVQIKIKEEETSVGIDVPKSAGSGPVSAQASPHSPRDGLSRKRKAGTELDERRSKTPDTRSGPDSANQDETAPAASEALKNGFLKEPPKGPKALQASEAQAAANSAALANGTNPFANMAGAANGAPDMSAMMNMMNNPMMMAMMMPQFGGMGMPWANGAAGSGMDTSMMNNMNMNMNPNLNMNAGHMYGNANNAYASNGPTQNFRGGRGRGGYGNAGRGRGGGFQDGGRNAENSAYFRQPVNPHRHQNRRNNTTPPTNFRDF